MHGTCRPCRLGYGAVTSGGRAPGRVYDARVLSPDILGRTLAEAPDPELARVAISRVGDDPVAREQLARPEVLPVAVRLLGFSTAAADFLVRHPEEVATLADVRPRTRAELDAELADDIAARGPEDGLRVFRRRAMLRVAARDLDGASLEDVVEEISRVAEACLEAALRLAAGDVRMAVIGLGKLGGGELNYASDVDLIFVHADAGAQAQDAAERAATVLIRSLAEPTAEGIALRGGPHAPPGRTRRAAVAEPRIDARLLRAPVRHVGAPGDDQGAIRRRRPMDRFCVRRGRGAVRVSGRPGHTCHRRRPSHQGASGGVHPAARQGADRGEARPRRHPRRRVRGAAAADRARAARPDAARAEHAPCVVHARGGGVRGAGRRRGAGGRVSVPATAGAPTADRPRPADARPPGGSARAHHARALARPGGCRRAAGPVRTSDRVGPRDPRAAVLPAVAGSVRGAGGAEPRRGPSRRPRSCSRAGFRVDVAVVRGAATAGRPRHADGERCSRTCSR